MAILDYFLSQIPVTNIRNFCIIAHIDHGKSTLANAMLVENKQLNKQKDELVMDNLLVEQNRGITVKLNTCQLPVKFNKQVFLLNLIDTPGHSDFGYEVNRSISASDFCLLLVDASQGIEAQTITNFHLAINAGKDIIPVINKIDMPNANVSEVTNTMINYFGFKPNEIIKISAKKQINIDKLIAQIINFKINFPVNNNSFLKALIFDCNYNQFGGIIIFIRIFSGEIKLNDELWIGKAKLKIKATKLGIKTPNMVSINHLYNGYAGWIETGIKDISKIRPGDYVTQFKTRSEEMNLPSFGQQQHLIYYSFFPAESGKFKDLKLAITTLALNDASISVMAINNHTLGFGYMCGFLGKLHADVIRERIENEFHQQTIISPPLITYKILTTANESILISNPSMSPSLSKIAKIFEPMASLQVFIPAEYIGSVMNLVTGKRGTFVSEELLDTHFLFTFKMPLAEIINNFVDELKSITSGLGSFTYSLFGYEESKIVKLDVLINHEVVDFLSFFVHQSKGYEEGNKICLQLKSAIVPQQFAIAIQAAINNKIIARQTVPALRKDVLSKCYGGDISRKRKLLQKQKKGKKRLKQFGKISLDRSALINIFKTK